MMMPPYKFLLLPISILAIAWTVPAQAQNLLTNSSFDATTSGWFADATWINPFHDAEDAFASGTPGSVRVVNTRATPGGNGIFQCLLDKKERPPSSAGEAVQV